MTAHTPSPPLWQLLAATATALRRVREGRSATTALAQVAPPLRPGTQALLFATLRQLGRAQALRAQLAPRPPAAATDALLCTALALLAAPDAAPYEPYTLVNQAVQAARHAAARSAQAGFVNACLRRFLRERPALMAATDADEVARTNHPAWWLRRLRQDHPHDWERIVHANNVQPSMTLRVSESKTTVARYQQALAAIGMEATAIGASGVVLRHAVPVAELPGFQEGQVSVQDAAAQRAAPLLLQGLDARQPLRILDACAAPGGKTAHLLDYAGARAAPWQVIALEQDATRAARIHDNLRRLGLAAQVLVADAGAPDTWWGQAGGRPLDAILLDAPCTASGIVRRHPDVRWLRREGDIAQLARQQARLLAALWPQLAPGGRLLYCTCSVFRAEGQAQVEAFLAHNTDAHLLPSPGHLLPVAPDKSGTVPDNEGGEHDGFFYALLQRSRG
ncbi:MAG: 16S rRNA (cytosine(967)-C(5))-methyltransferase RsmB [Comamonadaceae bacterium]|nr:16S rRNA (cytosine(967)-C(5))-methyltransferase RsmB [Burkholderiales bacterium]MEB2349768.1 16S rRNA (cytosine(967)-C(5))-methyltransferase RsmB [Comamonadaceae bacterium]